MAGAADSRAPEPATLTDVQRRLLAARLRSHAAPAADDATIGPRDPDQPPVMSTAQRGLFLVDEVAGGTNAYNVAQALRLNGPLDETALQRSLDELVRRHEVLRTRFHPDGTITVLEPAPVRIARSSAAENDLEAFVVEQVKARFDLGSGELVRAALAEVTSEDHVLVLVVHHIASDAVSKQILNDELGALYAAFREGAASPLPEPTLQYADYAAWAQRRGSDWSEVEWWRERLAGAPEQIELPFDRLRPVDGSHAGSRWVAPLPDDVADLLTAFCAERRVTPYMVLLAGYAALVERYGRQGSVVVGSAVTGRHDRALDRTVGLFLNTLPVRIDTAGAPGFAALVEVCRTASVDVLRHQGVPFETIVDDLRPERVPGRNPIFQTTLTWRTARNTVPTLPGLNVTSVPFEGGWSKFDLALICFPVGDQIRIVWEYSSDLFDESTVHRLSEQLSLLLRAGLQEPERPITTLELTTPDDVAALTAWNATGRTLASDPIHMRVSEWARRTPDAPAVGDDDGWLSYREFEEQTNRLAHLLVERGVRPDDRVAVCLQRSRALAVAIWAVLKAGGAYVPLDPDYPADRLAFMLTDSGARVLLTDSVLRSTLPPHRETVAVDETELDDRPTSPPPVEVGPGHLAYVIYTSGTTGNPKGVAQTHGAVTNQMTWMQERYALDQDDVVLHKTPYSFDVSTWELLLAPFVGTRLLMAAPGRHGDPWYLRDVIAAQGVTVLNFVPSMLRAFLAAEVADPTGPLRLIIACGEALPDDVKDACLRALPDTVLDNVYGPTETIGVTAEYTALDREVTLGRPGANCTAYVLDEEHRLLPPGMPGELWLGGDQLARGYLGRDDLTEARFVPTPLGRLYSTGDRCSWGADGLLRYHGRLDDQVKLRGMRVELAEIEEVLAAHVDVESACCVVTTTPSGDQLLAAYVVPTSTVERPDDLVESLLVAARARLPRYMVPQAVVVAEELPLTPAGKLDRLALERREVALTVEDHVVPATDTERRLEQVWCRELALSGPISTTRSFFDIGGSSLVALRMFPAIEREFSVNLNLAMLFENVTISTLATAIDAEMARADPWETVVTIQPLGDRTPLFAVPALRGSAILYRQMSQYFDTRRPVHVVEAVGLDGRQPARTTIAGFAQDAAAAVRRVQPHGPYHLTGFCFGGVVAYEVAALLEASGETVAFVGVIDGTPYGRWLNGRVRRRIANRNEWGWWVTVPRRIRAYRNAAVLSVTSRLGRPGPRRFVDVITSARVAQRSHRTSFSRLHVDLFMGVRRGTQWAELARDRWTGVAAGGCELHLMDGDTTEHLETVKGDQARRIATLINERLAALP